MRLFVAIRFDHKTEAFFTAAVAGLKRLAASGAFTRRETLHLTLAFLGEVQRVEAAKQAVREVHADAFDLRLGGLGRFRREGGDICWIGAEDSGPLQALHSDLCGRLDSHGFSVDKRPYRPHLTLGRRVILPADFRPETFPMQMTRRTVAVRSIALMESARTQGELVYTPLLEQPLNR